MITSLARATAAARYPAQCVMLPTMPDGHCGAPAWPGRMGAGADAERAEGAARAVPAGGELAAAFWHRPREQRLLGRE